MANFHQAAAAGMQQTTIGNHPCAHVMVNHHLNHVARSPRSPEQRFGHGPGADVVLDIHRHAGMRLQRFPQRNIFDVIKGHAMNNAIFGIDDARQRDSNGR